MSWKREWKILALIFVVFVVLFYLPVGTERFDRAILEALHLAKWYAQEHVIFCLVPAFFIAGAIAVFVRQSSVIKYLGARANKGLAYGVASVSGTILAVCSCTILPLFAGIYRRGAGLGPATAFLYSGPAINILAIILTARVLGLELGIARALGAVLFSVVVGLLMSLVFRNEEDETIDTTTDVVDTRTTRPLWQNALFFVSMVGILVFANWGKPSDPHGIWYSIYSAKWLITSTLGVAFAAILILWFNLKWWQVVMASLPAVLLTVALGDEPLVPFVAGVVGLSVITSTDKGETGEWFESSWDLAKQILPLLFIGVLIAGFCLGRPGEHGVIPSRWVSSLVGDNSIGANFFASVVGAFMYFATLTEVPILEGLLGAGMGKGPALALLLAGPALSLPNMLVIRSVIGTRKTIVFVSLVVVMATVSGVIYGNLFE
ncbi:MAG: permease [Candidatus Latescibacterota bacterium]|nr:MAG: permease [Candidatus Latescibacterota bacterium]